MDLKTEIAQQVNALPHSLQQRVHEYVASLSSQHSEGRPGSAFVLNTEVLDPISAREMIAAIEADCEHVDAGEW